MSLWYNFIFCFKDSPIHGAPAANTIFTGSQKTEASNTWVLSCLSIQEGNRKVIFHGLAHLHFLKCTVFSNHWSNAYSARNLSLPQTLRYINVVIWDFGYFKLIKILGFQGHQSEALGVSVRQKIVLTEVRIFLITLSFQNSFSCSIMNKIKLLQISEQ